MLSVTISSLSNGVNGVYPVFFDQGYCTSSRDHNEDYEICKRLLPFLGAWFLSHCYLLKLWADLARTSSLRSLTDDSFKYSHKFHLFDIFL
jgi:hypothetical protein